MPPNASFRCWNVACPWCVLQVAHGDYEQAQRSYRQALCDPRIHDRPHLGNMAWHAISDIVEQAQLQGIDLKIDSALEQPPYLARIAQYGALSPVRILSSTATPCWSGYKSSMRSSSALKCLHDRPVRTPCEQWSGDHATSVPQKKVTIREPLPILPERACFQVWGGINTLWITYDKGIQRILQEAYKRHGIATFRSRSGKRNYEVNTDPEVMTQRRTDLATWETATVRKVRVKLLEDDLFAV